MLQIMLLTEHSIMLNHRTSGKKAFDAGQPILALKDMNAWPQGSTDSRPSHSMLITPKQFTSLSVKEAFIQISAQVAGSSWFLLIMYFLLVSALTSLGLFLYSRVVDFHALSLQITTNIIYIFLWATLLSLPVITLLIIHTWRVHYRYKNVKAMSLLCWTQLEELCHHIHKVRHACQANENPECSILIKCLDTYYTEYTAFNTELGKITLFIDDHSLKYLISRYQLVSQNFRDKLNDLIIAINDHPFKQEPCPILLQQLLPLTENMDHYHQLLSKELIRIMRY